jgi:hypothetical protein
LSRSAVVREERDAWEVHRETIRGSAFPPARSRRPPTFLHGFLLPFSLIATTLRHPGVGLSYLRVTVVRSLVVGLIAALAFRTEHFDPQRAAGIHYSAAAHEAPEDSGISYERKEKGADGKLHTKKKHVKGVHVDDGKLEVDTDDTDTVEGEAPAPAPAAKAAPWIVRVMEYGWAWVLWFIGIVSLIEGFVAFMSRRWDDWLGHCISPLARVQPEDRFPPERKLTLFEPRWLIKKAWRRLRGYLAVASAIPLALLFRLIPTVGDALFGVAITVWSWYWIAVFTTAKTAHAWADVDHAPPPLLLRELRDRSAGIPLLRPVHRYARLWCRVTRGLHAPAAVFERNPRPMLGLALARVVLSLPGLYLLARPILPVAAGRLIAETDPADRFSA